MIRLLSIWLLILATLNPAPCVLRLLLVVPPGETLTVDEQEDYRQRALNALDWWVALAPNPIAVEISATEIITPGVDVYHDLRDWSMPYLTEHNLGAVLFLIDNSASNALLFDTSGGESQPYYRAAWAVMHGVPDAEAIIAHELGHTIYGLEHPDPCAFPDIMCAQGYVQPYRQYCIGCLSLAALGQPCDHHSYLSAVAQ